MILSKKLKEKLWTKQLTSHDDVVSKKIIVVVGPTASGKSDFAVKIAKTFNGEIVSADSRQVYKGLDIGSGKVPRDRSLRSDVKYAKYYYYHGIRHHLIDVASPKRIFTVAQYQKLTREAIYDIWQRGKLPILCGGTGFYIDAVLNGAIIPEVKPNKILRKKLEKKSTAELFLILKKLDPERARNIDRYNPRRLVRAIEIAETLGKIPPLKINPLKADVFKIGISKNEKNLKKLIEKRLLRRIKEGMIKEVHNLHKNNLSWKRLEDLGLEYRYVARYLQDKITKKEMVEILKKEIWRYAKRQMTWFKRDKKIIWINNKTEFIDEIRIF